jgi:cell division septation protein DedD
MAGTSIRLLALTTVAALALAGCEPGAGPVSTAPEGGAVAAATSVKLVDRDVEAPDVFQVSDQALWDGRPSLGGVWVASPDAVDPERVILRNPANGKFVIGALFRRERDNPGPKLQISSDAAAALGLLAGQPGKISVTALRREEAPAATDVSKPILDASETVETAPLDTVAIASGAIDKAEGKPAKGPAVPTAPAAKPAAAAPAVTAAPATGGGVIQIGIFSVEANAQRAVDALTKAGIAVSSRKEESQGKPLWSVTARGDAALLAKIKSAGFGDAYFLKRG